MKKHLALALGLLLIGAALAGCGKSTKPSSSLDGSNVGSISGGSSVDAAQVTDTLSQHPELVEETLYEDPTPILYADAPVSSALAAIQPFRWWRTITSDTRTVDITFSNPDSSGQPTAALVTIHRHLLGTFNVIAGDTAATDSVPRDSMRADTTRRLIRKPLDDSWVRELTFERIVDPDSASDGRHHQRHWRILGTSGVVVTSLNATTAINSLRIQAGAIDTTITDPLALRFRPRLMLLPALAMIKVTVTTGRNNDVVVLYRDFMRRRFVNNGDDTYTVTFPSWDFWGMRHFGVNALSHGTLFDDTAPYDSKAWILPFASRVAYCDVGRD
ncbi:MAG TPA: hypothetical protein VMH61_07320 [Candidatus Acidoferrales bacterium]|nr:hypothetical protein [Candidatus Acidoferrales bacterium]